jgi:succinate-acetate transporter protein
MSYATILIPGTGVIAAYGEDEAELSNALGIYLLGWGLVTFILLFVTFPTPPHISTLTQPTPLK